MFRVLPFIVTVFFLRMYQFIVAIVSSPRVIVVTESPKVKGVVILYTVVPSGSVRTVFLGDVLESVYVVMLKREKGLLIRNP